MLFESTTPATNSPPPLDTRTLTLSPGSSGTLEKTYEAASTILSEEMPSLRIQSAFLELETSDPLNYEQIKEKFLKAYKNFCKDEFSTAINPDEDAHVLYLPANYPIFAEILTFFIKKCDTNGVVRILNRDFKHRGARKWLSNELLAPLIHTALKISVHLGPNEKERNHLIISTLANNIIFDSYSFDLKPLLPCLFAVIKKGVPVTSIISLIRGVYSHITPPKWK